MSKIPPDDWPEVDWSGQFDAKEDPPSHLKFDDGKTRWSLLPWDVLEEVAKVFEHGAKKYGDFNWELCNQRVRYWDAAMRHVVKYQQGQDSDESGLHVLDHAIASLMILRGLQLRNQRAVMAARKAGTL